MTVAIPPIAHANETARADVVFGSLVAGETLSLPRSCCPVGSLTRRAPLLAAPPLARPKTRAAEPELPDSNGHVTPRTRASIAVHSFPARKTVVEPHILKSSEAIAIKPMSMEEAVKDAEFRDRDLLIFRNPAGDLYVLHRRRDGQMELVEIP